MRLMPLAYYFDHYYQVDARRLTPQCRLCGWEGVHPRSHLRMRHSYFQPTAQTVIDNLEATGKKLVAPRIEKRRVMK